MSMGKSLLCASLVLLAGIPAQAADGGLNGNYLLVYFQGVREAPLAIVKLETKEGKLEGSVVAGGPIGATKVSKVSVEGKLIHFDLGGGNSGNFEGVIAGDTVPGSFQIGTNLLTAKLIKTKDEAMPTGAVTQLKVPEYTQATAVENAKARLQFQARRETDKEKKADLLKQAAEATQKAAMEVPKLYREVMEKYPDSPVVITVGKALLGNSKIKATPEEARKWIATVSRPLRSMAHVSPMMSPCNLPRPWRRTKS